LLKSSIGATGDIISVNSIRNKELWSPMLFCGEFYNDTVKSMPTTPNIQVKITHWCYLILIANIKLYCIVDLL